MSSTDLHDHSTTNFFDGLRNFGKLELVSFISKLPIPIAIFDENAVFLGLNQFFADIYESDALYLMNKKLNEFSTIVYAHLVEAIAEFKLANSCDQIENEFYSKGHFYILYMKVIRNVDKQIDCIIVVCADVTRLKRKERVLLQTNKKLHDYLYIDQTTGLKNKMALEEYLSKNFIDARREQFSFIKIDLDDFKKFNQLNSYTIGDGILRQLGELFTEEITQDNAQLYRLNSASFVISIEKSTPWKVLTVAERIRQKIHKEQIHFEKDTDEILTVTIGIYHPSIHENFIEVDIMEQLDVAINQAKELGNNSIFVLE